MMNKHILKLLLLFLLVFAYGCESYLDVNHDPDVLEEVNDPKIILPSSQIALANNLMGWDFGFGGGFWSEYWTQSYNASQFKTLCEYQETSFSNAYTGLLSEPLTDYKRIKELSSDEANQGYYYIAEALSIYTWQLVTDLWGDVPYSEALRGNEGILSPKFESGESIYADLLNRVNVLANMDPTAYTIKPTSDFIYGGNMEDWAKFVNSLKLKLMLRLSETSNYDNSTVLTFINNNSFLTNSAKIAGSYWSDDQEGKRHPMREFQQGGANYLSGNVIACKNFIDYLSSNDDPRIDAIFEAPEGGVHKGAFFGDFDSKQDSDQDGTNDEDEDYSTAKFSGTMDLMIMSDWEVNFYIAEVYARADDMSNAKMYYDMGVTASLAQNEIPDTDIITSGYAMWENGSLEENIERISLQSWVANANYQHIESFLNRNRTKYPSLNSIDIKSDRNAAFQNFPVGQLTVSVNGREKTNGRLPASPVYPTSLLNRNVNSPDQKVDLLEKIWWDKKIGN